MRGKLFSAILLFGLLSFATSKTEAHAQAPAPTYRDGDTWVFRVAEKDFQTQSTQALDGDYEVTFQNGKFIVRLADGERPETKQNLSQIRRMLHVPDDEHQLLQFPLTNAKEWETSYTSDSRGSSQPVRNTAETKVMGNEEINTSVGSFKVIKLERFETEGRGGKGGAKGRTKRETYTYYYSPEVRAIVKYAYEGDRGQRRNIELVKYTPAP